MSRMKFVGDAESAVFDAFSGFQKMFPACTVDPERRIVISNHIEKGKVALISGGGSGHEPFSTGFVGQGMLSGAVAGLIFTSPPSHNILITIRTLAEQNNNAGVLLILINYTGDVLNFGLACEEARALGIKVDHVAIEDDISIIGDKVQGAGRRGMAGVCASIKIVGHMARLGKGLSELIQEYGKINENIATLGCAVTACAVPGIGPLFEIESDKIEIGLGIHGEVGTERIERPSIDEVIEIMLTRILSAMKLPSNPRVCVFLNNLGATSYLELGIITGKIHSSLTKKNIRVDRMYHGSLVTSLDMAGFQISVLNVTENPAWVDCLDSPTDAPGWPGTCLSIPGEASDVVPFKDEENRFFDKVGPKINTEKTKFFEKCLRNISSVLIKEESRLNELDSMSGDGDAGSTLKKIADVILKELPNINLEYPATSLYQISKLCQNEMGGSSGALYGIFLTSAAKSISSSSNLDIASAWKTAIDTLAIYSKAKVGDRTMMDVIIPAYEEFSKQIKQNRDNKMALEETLKVAKLKCEETRHMKPRLGRASYVPKEYIKDVDPGAYGVVLWLEAILNTIKS